MNDDEARQTNGNREYDVQRGDCWIDSYTEGIRRASGVVPFTVETRCSQRRYCHEKAVGQHSEGTQLKLILIRSGLGLSNILRWGADLARIEGRSRQTRGGREADGRVE